MSLARLQQQFADQLLAPPRETTDLAVSGPAPAAQLLQLYRNNFHLSLGDYLSACYPATRALVGEEFFAQFARAYVQQHPLREPAVEGYGAALAAFAAACPQAQSLPWLSAFIELEWQLESAKQTPPPVPFPFAALAHLAPEEQQRVRFKLARGVVLIDSPFPLFGLWRGVQQGDLAQVDLSQREAVAIRPTEPGAAELLYLPPEQFQLLDQLHRGAVLAELTLPELTSPDHFQALIGTWIQQGLIDNFQLLPPEDAL